MNSEFSSTVLGKYLLGVIGPRKNYILNDQLNIVFASGKLEEIIICLYKILSDYNILQNNMDIHDNIKIIVIINRI